MYKFNSGRGAVVCDKCKTIFDSDLSLQEYDESYGKSGHDGDFCTNCLTGTKKRDRIKVEDIFDDGWRN